jgi:hypothetical protein
MPETVYRIYLNNDGAPPDVREVGTLADAHDLTHYHLARRKPFTDVERLEVVDFSYRKDDRFYYKLDGKTVASIRLELKRPAFSRS